MNKEISLAKYYLVILMRKQGYTEIEIAETLKDFKESKENE